jgi:hypothetical protein
LRENGRVGWEVNVVAASDLTVVATAAVTAVATLAAAVLTQAAVARREARRSRLELAGRRRDELRTVLEASGSALEEARAAFDRRRVAKQEDHRRETGVEFDVWVSQVRQRENQIAMRLSRDDPAGDILGSYRQAREKLERLAEIVYEAGNRPPDPNEVKPVREALASARDEFVQRAGRYFQADGRDRADGG